MLKAMDTETQNGYAILITKPYAFCEPKTFDDCVDFLANDREMMCWNSDYDCQACLKYLPRLYRDRLALTHEVRYMAYWIKYVPHKFMRLWERGPRDKWYHRLTIYDLRQFYNCSLATAAEKLGVQEKLAIPQYWYANMAKYLKDPRTRFRVLDYALGDAATLQAIIDRTVEAFALAGLKFERPFSNASFAERYFRKRFRYSRNMTVERMAKLAYHGGRIECVRTGTFPVAWNIDIHSAYPAEIAGLEKPNGEWYYEQAHKGHPIEVRSDCRYMFADCRITIPKTALCGPIPYKRLTGSIIYPIGTFRKVITLTEYRYLERKGYPVTILRAWMHIWSSGFFPFKEIYEIYQRRKADPRVDYALKIVMNATYGKFAQTMEADELTNIVDQDTRIFDERIWRKREFWKNHTSFVYASEITARIRIRILDDIPPKSVITYSTDGLFTLQRCRSLHTGPGLGEWGKAEKVRNLTVVGSGVYTYQDKAGDWKIKFRGFSPAIDLGVLLWKAGSRHEIVVRVLRNTSLRLAYLRKMPREMNVLRKITRYLDVNFDTKRYWTHKWTARELMLNQYLSKPWIYYGRIKVPMYDNGTNH